LVGVGHVGFFADFLDFAPFNGETAFDDVAAYVCFGVG
jgi:hypothetical protein